MKIMRMKTTCLLFIFFIFGCATTPEKKNALFSWIPSQLDEEDARKAVQSAALQREWQVKDDETEDMEIELKHRGYHAILIFTFSDGEIRYSDDSTYFSTGSDSPELNYSSSNPSEGRWVKRSAKKDWIENLKHDVSGIFSAMIVEGKSRTCSSPDPIAEKLISLKALYDQNLIAELEYQQKREEILSEY